MGAFTSVTHVATLNAIGGKVGIFTAVGPASYDAGGSVIDLSTNLTADQSFTSVKGVQVIGMGASASAKYWAAYITGASVALGKAFLRDLTAASDAEASGDLSSHTFTFAVFGK